MMGYFWDVFFPAAPLRPAAENLIGEHLSILNSNLVGMVHLNIFFIYS
jgi:hypothetical protein